MFGKSMNLTAISVLAALVLWGSIWGIQGAVLSVPLLAVQKILLDAADYPMAKQALNVIREDNSLEESVERQKSMFGADERKVQQYGAGQKGGHFYGGGFDQIQAMEHHARLEHNQRYQIDTPLQYGQQILAPARPPQEYQPGVQQHYGADSYGAQQYGQQQQPQVQQPPQQYYGQERSSGMPRTGSQTQYL
eukprot:SAG31_NODE_2980_length_4829_cov_3.156237_5_plen_192_part_00